MREFGNGWYGPMHGFGHGPGMRGGWRMKRGFVRQIVLNLLSDESMHGYDIINKLEEQSHGYWRPSPGSIYPTLQMLEDEGLIKSTEKSGKKVYSLTDSGKKEIADLGKFKMPWEAKEKDWESYARLRTLVQDVMLKMRQIGFGGSETQKKNLEAELKAFADKIDKIAKSE